MKKKYIILIISIFIISVICLAFIFTNKTDSNLISGYYTVVSSNMLDNKSRLLSFDKEGELIDSKTINAQDLYFSNINNSQLIVCGQRSSDNLIIEKDFEVSELNLWTKENETGVSAMQIEKQRIYALMNTGFSNGTYKNTLIVQDFKGQVTDKKSVEIVGSNIIVEDNYAILSGSETNSQTGSWYGKIIIYNLESKEIEKEVLFKEYSEITKVLIKNKNIYFVAKKLNVEKDSIIKSTIAFDEQETIYEGITISELNLIENSAYFIDDTNLKIINLNEENDIILTEELIDTGYYANSVLHNGKILITMRYSEKKYEDGKVFLGKIIEYNINSKQKESIELKVPEKYNSDTFLAFPNTLFK